jgi:succinate-semialdehyde dehydrogenase/glutarate-semialdehyde dehydrogenase
MYAVTNPATGEVLERFPTATDAQIREVLDRSQAGYLVWKDRALAERAEILARVGRAFAGHRDELAAIITTEMGKRPAEARGEVDIAADIFAYYAEQGPQMLADEQLTITGGAAVVRKLPVGPLLGIMPWNYPYYQVARFAAPNLLLGNTILLKHAPSCPRSSAAIERLLDAAGVPDDAYINLYADNDQVATILADPRVQGVSVTGSERAGAAVAAVAGQHLKKVVLELGGSDPMIVLDSTDVAETARLAAAARMSNSGQACNAPKRMIVLRDIYDEFLARLVDEVRQLRPGDPTDAATTLAPLSSTAAADRLVAQIDSAVQAGAVVHTGGKRLDRPGAFVEPTVITGISRDMPAYFEELFGPVAVVYRADDDAEAVALANDTPYGLGASVIGTDPDRARAVADRIEAGMVYLNLIGGSQADLPFGGIKRSGIGRELGPLGIEEFMNKKVIRL